MSSAICTLFEGDYQYGLGAFVNSLHARGYRGTVYTGYRGGLPVWAGGARQKDGWADLEVADGLKIRFLPLTTKVHLTNYKPDFMQEIWKKQCPDADSLFYFDPDITIKCRWEFFEQWAEGGVALCEDINSPMPSTHPIRNAWRKYYGKLGRTLSNKLDIYVNGGFVGVSRANRGFIEEWDRIQQEMSPAAGNMMDWGLRDRTFEFCLTDQDALNITLMHTPLPYSLSERGGMDIDKMGYMMSHALGVRKPWRRRYMWERVVRGFPVSYADKTYWANVSHPIEVFSGWQKKLRKADMMGSIALDRFL